jgi:hypothetical protein
MNEHATHDRSRATSACCHHDPGAPVETHSHHATHGGHGDTPLRIAAHATLHCLAGCVVGEIAGLLIGVGLGLAAWQTVLLATVLSYASGFSLGLWPLVKRGMGVARAFRTIWLGEAVSIGVMEIAMNLVDYLSGGMGVKSVLAPQFWIGFALAAPAGFLAAWPVNWWLLRNRIKAPCH